MEILKQLHSYCTQDYYQAVQQLRQLSAGYLVDMYCDTQDVVLLTVVDCQQLDEKALRYLSQSEHRKASYLIARFAVSGEAQFGFCTYLLCQMPSELVRVNYAIELLLLRSNMQKHVYELAIQLTCQDFYLRLNLLSTICVCCYPVAEHFAGLLNHEFLKLGMYQVYVGPTSRMLLSLFNKFDYRSEYSADSVLLANMLEFLLETKCLEDDAVELVSRLFVLTANKRLRVYHLFVPFLHYCVHCLRQFSHFKCYLLLPGLIKLFENRQIYQVRNAWLQLQANYTPETQAVFDAFVKSTSVRVEVVYQYSNSIDYLLSELVYLLLRYIDKRSMKNLLELGNYNYNIVPELVAHEDELYCKYHTYDPLFWIDWLGSLKTQVSSFYSKAALLFPQLCLGISHSIVYNAWAMLQEANPSKMVTYKEDIYVTFDVGVFFAETVVCCVIKQLINENDYVKQTMLNLETYFDVVQLLLVTQFQQPAILYRTLEAAFEIVKFLSRLANVQPNQLQLITKHWDFLSRVTKTILQQICTTINFRMPGESALPQNQLFQRLSQDTLALRRMIASKLAVYMSSELLNTLLTEKSDMSEDATVGFAFHNAMMECIDGYFNNCLLTESEIVRLTLVKLSIMVNIDLISKKHSMTQQAYLLHKLMGQVLGSVQRYFLSQEIQGAIANYQAFVNYFKINPLSLNIITTDSIQPKRALQFRLEEALSTLPKIQQIALSQDVILLLESLMYVIGYLLELLLYVSSQNPYLSPSFVYNNTSLKVDLLAQSFQQYLQVDTDSQQAVSSETGYTLEWLENGVSLSLQTLISTNQTATLTRILQQFSQVSLPFSTLKVMFDKIQRLNFAAVGQDEFASLYEALSHYIVYFYYPHVFLYRLSYNSPYYAMFYNYLASLPECTHVTDASQIINRTDYITKEQIDVAVHQIEQASAKSYLELVSKFFYDYNTQTQNFELQPRDIAFLTTCCFVESKPSRILQLMELISFACDASNLLPALLLLAFTDSGVGNQVVGILSKNPAAFPNIGQYLAVTYDQLCGYGAKRYLLLALTQARIVE